MRSDRATFGWLLCLLFVIVKSNRSAKGVFIPLTHLVVFRSAHVSPIIVFIEHYFLNERMGKARKIAAEPCALVIFHAFFSQEIVTTLHITGHVRYIQT